MMNNFPEIPFHIAQVRTAKSKISDLLPSTIIDEIDVKTPKLATSYNHIPNYYPIEPKFSHSSNNSMKTLSTTVSHNTSQNDMMHYHHTPHKHLSNYNKKAYSDNQIFQQKVLFHPDFSNSHLNNITNNFGSFSHLSYYHQNYPLNNQSQHSSSSFANQNNQAPQMSNQFFHKNAQNLIQNLNNPNLVESQIDSLTSLSSIKSLVDATSPQIILQYIKTSKGSRHLQKIINSSPPSQYETDILVKILCPTIAEIMCDYYGNYFMQKFFAYCSLSHRLLFYKFIQPNFCQIANNICGNHSLQCLIMLQNTKEEMAIIKDCVELNLQNLAFGANSSHVVQKVIKSIKESNRDYINAFIISNLIDLCLDSNGICIVKEFINGLENEFYIVAVASMLELETNKLTYDQYGNFGIQEIIKKFGVQYCGKIINKIVEHVFMFSISKFSSNVVDCVIRHLYKNDLHGFCKVVMKIIFDDNCLNEMLKNKYATYVLENCLTLLFSCTNIKNTNPDLYNLQIGVLQILLNKPLINEKRKIYKIIHNFSSSIIE